MNDYCKNAMLMNDKYTHALDEKAKEIRTNYVVLKEKKIMKLKETIELMCSNDYKERFIAEYNQTKIRYEKLKNFCNKIEVEEMLGKEETKHDCPLELLREQQKYMGLYLSILEKRALIENVEL